jgi:hypothetical protein
VSLSHCDESDIYFVKYQVEETANGYGGAGIFAKEGVTVSLSGSASVMNNRANQCGGGGIRISHGTRLSLSGAVDVRGNLGDMGGGIFAEQKSAVSIADRVRFEQNVAYPNGGGAIFISGLDAQFESTCTPCLFLCYLFVGTVLFCGFFLHLLSFMLLLS